ncbi:hypothetical protein ACLUUV_15255 [Enterobacterales bacterium L_CKDN230030145-1A_HGKHYDSX7]
MAGFSDRQVNSSIGPQWNGKIDGIQTTAERIPPAARKRISLNVKIYKRQAKEFLWMRQSAFL